MQNKQEKEINNIVLKSACISEKVTDLSKLNQYVFKVSEKANKNEIKKAIESFYKVDVVSVRIINTPSKKRKRGKISGWKKGYKKAIVKLKEDQKIEPISR